MGVTRKWEKKRKLAKKRRKMIGMHFGKLPDLILLHRHDIVKETDEMVPN
jgi:hypothetical protein